MLLWAKWFCAFPPPSEINNLPCPSWGRFVYPPFDGVLLPFSKLLGATQQIVFFDFQFPLLISGLFRRILVFPVHQRTLFTI